MLNEGQYRLGILKHAPPSFKFFDPIETEGRPLIIKEVTVGSSNSSAYELLVYALVT